MTKSMETALRNSEKKTEEVRELIAKVLDPTTSDEARHLYRLTLVQYINCKMHALSFKPDGTPKGGKIAGIPSIDGNALNTAFCQQMRKLAEEHPELRLICGMCYACSPQEIFKTLAQMAHVRNVLILSQVEFTDDELATLYIPCDLARPYCRINEDGDTVNATHARNIIRIMRTHPQINFAWWYKNRSAVYTALDEMNKPDNCRIVFSVPTVSAPIDRIRKMAGRWDDAVFAVFKTAEEVDKAVADGFVKCNGIKCFICGFRCYRPSDGGVLYIAEQMRK